MEEKKTVYVSWFKNKVMHIAADLFSAFDSGFGATVFFFSSLKWYSSIMMPVFLLSFVSFWFSSSYLESVILRFTKLFSSKLPGEVKNLEGGAHMFSTLICVLLMIGLGGVMPFHQSLCIHFFIVGSLAMPFWLSGLFLSFNPNVAYVLLKMIHKGNYLFPSAMIIIAEFMSVLIRPLTLTARFVANATIGQVILHLIFGKCVFLIFPVVAENWASEVDYSGLSAWLLSWCGVVSLMKNLIVCGFFILLGSSFMLVEVGVMTVQAFIFSGLLVFYVVEVPMKLIEKVKVVNSSL